MKIGRIAVTINKRVENQCNLVGRSMRQHDRKRDGGGATLNGREAARDTGLLKGEAGVKMKVEGFMLLFLLFLFSISIFI